MSSTTAATHATPTPVRAVPAVFGSCTPNFGAAAHFGAGLAPDWVRQGDFNGDGRSDLAVANAASESIWVLLGQPGGAFAPPVSVPVGENSWSLTIGDFNEDGHLDIAVAGIHVVVLLGDGLGGFQNVGGPAGDAGYSIVAGDANGDGHLDLFAAGTNVVAVFPGDGMGHFGPRSDYPVGNAPAGVAAADFNEDGHLDLAATNSDDDTVSILLGSGTGTFSPGIVVPVGDRPWDLVAGDLNGDGHADLAVVDLTYGVVSILLGDGAGGFSAAPDAGFGAAAVAIADFNGDGKADLATAGSSPAQVLLGDGAGGFTPRPGAYVGVGSFSLAIADFDGDGRADVAVANYFSNNVAVALGDGDGNLGPKTSFPASALRPIDVAFADFDGDGKLDAATYDNNTNEVSVLKGDGSGGFGAPVTFATAADFGQGLIAADFNGDGKPDVAVSGGFAGNVSILLGQGGGALGPPTALTTASFPESLAAGDFNEDGKLDLAVAGNGFTIFLGDGSGGFGAPTAFAGDYYAYGIDAADLNHDGHLDLVVSNSEVGPGLNVFLGDGAGGFGAPTGFQVGGTNPLDVVFGDFNEDGNLDVAVSLFDEAGNGASVLLGDGHGGFGPPTRLTFTRTGVSITAADFDRDGHLDLAVGSFDGVSVMAGDGHGHFAGPLILPLGNSGVAAVDLNGDGRIDLGSVNPDQRTVTALLNSAVDLAPLAVPPGTVGLPYPGAMFSGNGATSPYTFEEAGDLPAGLTFDAASGALTGTPTQGGSFTFYVAAQDFNGCRFSRAYVLTVAPAVTSLVLTFTPDPAAAGSPVVFAATVVTDTPGITPTGVVTFRIDGVDRLPVALVGGVATYSTILGAGAHTVSATYQGSADFVASAVAPFRLDVTAGGPSATIPTLSPSLIALLAACLAAVGMIMLRR